MDAIREWGRADLSGLRPYAGEFQAGGSGSPTAGLQTFETWKDEGARDNAGLASLRVEKMLNDLSATAWTRQSPRRLDAFVATRKAAEPDSFSCNHAPVAGAVLARPAAPVLRL